jgi:hypothetical protein
MDALGAKPGHADSAPAAEFNNASIDYADGAVSARTSNMPGQPAWV